MKSLFPPDRPSWLLLVALLCCVLEGALRKWVVGDTSALGRLAYLSKDIVFFAIAMTGPVLPNRWGQLTKSFLGIGLSLLALGVATSSVSGFNPVGAILSIRSFFVL